jgi:periplasmic divalent cation tolerance protein
MLVNKQIVACVNVIKIRSVYSWKKKTMNTSEYLAIFKTTRQNIRKLKNEIRKTHPYKIPEIAELTISSINESYLKWLINPTN